MLIQTQFYVHLQKCIFIVLDLALGDCHLIPLDEDPDKVEHEDWV